MKLAIGSAQFGLDYGVSNNTGKVPNQEVNKILNVAKKSGINFLDTAIAYGNSESSLGLSNVSKFRTEASVVLKILNFLLTYTISFSFQNFQADCM